MKAPRSRQEATSGALPLSKAVASSAQRASWKEWRRLLRRGRAAGGGADRAAFGAERLAGVGGDVDRVAVGGVDHRAEQLAAADRVRRDHRRAGVGGERAFERPGGGGRMLEGEDEHRRFVADPERLQPPAQLGRLHAAAERPGEDVAGEPALGLAGDPAAHQLQRDDRDRLLQDQPLEVAEAARVADDHHPGLRRPAARRDHRVGQRPAGDRGVRGHEGVAVAGVAERLLADRRRSRRPRAGGGSRARRGARRGRRGSPTVPPTAEAIVAAISSRPRSSRTSRSSRRCTAMPRCSTSYCSLTSRAKAFSVIAMNGVE